MVTNDQSRLTHTSRMLQAMQQAYAEDFKHQNFAGRRRDARRLGEVTRDALCELRRLRDNPPK